MNKLLLFIFVVSACLAHYCSCFELRSCEAISANSFCATVGYVNTTFPNARSHADQAAANEELEYYKPLVELGCSHYLRHFLCAYYIPYCSRNIPLDLHVPPCRELCTHVREQCEPVVSTLEAKWPEFLSCDLFPTKQAAPWCFGPEDPSALNNYPPPTPQNPYSQPYPSSAPTAESHQYSATPAELHPPSTTTQEPHLPSVTRAKLYLYSAPSVESFSSGAAVHSINSLEKELSSIHPVLSTLHMNKITSTTPIHFFTAAPATTPIHSSSAPNSCPPAAITRGSNEPTDVPRCTKNPFPSNSIQATTETQVPDGLQNAVSNLFYQLMTESYPIIMTTTLNNVNPTSLPIKPLPSAHQTTSTQSNYQGTQCTLQSNKHRTSYNPTTAAINTPALMLSSAPLDSITISSSAQNQPSSTVNDHIPTVTSLPALRLIPNTNAQPAITNKPHNPINTPLTNTHHTCVTIDPKSRCHHYGYKKVHLPNRRGHHTQQEVMQELEQFSFFIELGCSPQMEVLLCLYYLPPCNTTQATSPLQPCKEFCQSVKKNCSIILSALALKWPDHMSCNALPALGNNPCMAGDLNKVILPSSTLTRIIGGSGVTGPYTVVLLLSTILCIAMTIL